MSEVRPTSNIADDYFNSRRWRRWKNVSDTTCPAYGLVYIARVETSSGLIALGFMNSDDAIEGTRPSSSTSIHQSHILLAANGPLPVAPGKEGLLTQDWPARVLSQSPPDKMSAGKPCGPKADSWLLWSGGMAFDAGVHFDSILDSYTIVEVWPRHAAAVPLLTISRSDPEALWVQTDTTTWRLNPILKNSELRFPHYGLPSWCFELEDEDETITILHGGLYTGLAWVTVHLSPRPPKEEMPLHLYELMLSIATIDPDGDLLPIASTQGYFPQDWLPDSYFYAYETTFLERGILSLCLPFTLNCSAGTQLRALVHLLDTPDDDGVNPMNAWWFGMWLYANRLTTQPYRAMTEPDEIPVPRGTEPH